ncbi:MAG: GNAT family N-acetyltransferase [Rhizobiaceae bacterium]
MSFRVTPPLCLVDHQHYVFKVNDSLQMKSVHQDLKSELYETKSIGSISITIHEQLCDIESAWRALEKTGICSAYQRYDWVQTWVETVAASKGMFPRLVIGVCGKNTQFIFPLGLVRRGPLTLVRWLGDSHSNFFMGLVDKSFATTVQREDMRTLFDGILSQLGLIDMVELSCQPRLWQGVQNPLALLPSRESNNHAYALDISEGFDKALDRKNRARKRKKFRWQQNKVAKYGGASLRVANTDEDVDKVIDIAFSQMAIRLGQAGIVNRFSGNSIDLFVRKLAKRSLGKKEPHLLLFSLEIGGKVRATLAGGVFDKQFSGCFLSYSQDELAYISPGEMIIYMALEECVKRKLSIFDLGRGEERYKSSWCDTTIELFETRQAMTALGKAYLACQNGKLELKRIIRRNDTLWSMAKSVRATFLGRKSG